MKKYIIYLGVLFMPDGNAAAHRANAIAHMIKINGYEPVVIGMKHDLGHGDILKTKEENFQLITYFQSYPKSNVAWLKRLYKIDEIIKVIEELGRENVHAVIAMDYFAVAFARLMKYCRKNGIYLIGDAVDWFARSAYPFPKNILKDFDTAYRMKILYKNIDRLIVISKYLENYYKGSVKNITYIPGVILKKESSRVVDNSAFDSQYIHLCFVGNPGVKCEKEKIDWVIQAICRINMNHDVFRFHVAGIEKKILRANRPDIFEEENIERCVRFLGRISYEQCLNLTKLCDFSVIARDDTILSNAGFPTKLSESFSCGTPTIVTPTSDLKDFVNDEYGYVSKECSYDSVYKLLLELSKITREEINRRKEYIIHHPRLVCEEYVDAFKKILQ